jgi:hypothetical protein
MAIAIVSETHGPTATLENYDKVVQILGGSNGGPHPEAACLFHWVTSLPGGGFRITNVFESMEAWVAFRDGKLAAARGQVGLDAPQKSDDFEVARFMT